MINICNIVVVIDKSVELDVKYLDDARPLVNF
jgi:hypothetical protein